MMTSDADFGNAAIVQAAKQLEEYARTAAGNGTRQYDVERETLSRALQIGKRALDLYLGLQGNGDLGPSVETDDGASLVRSAEPVTRRLRTIFGEHQFAAYVYSDGPKQRVALKPIDARLHLPASTFSYLFEEFSQYFCVEEAFATGAKQLKSVLGQKAPVDSLERISRRMGGQAREFLDSIPAPLQEEEGELLVLTADGKGVPLVKRDAERVPAFEKRERPGNRRIAILGGVYTVDSHVRTGEQILDALFREERAGEPPERRPEPVGKHLRGCFTRPGEEEGDEEISGPIETFGWLRDQVEKRRRPGQPVLLLMDGQPSLWDAAELCLGDLPDCERIEILDIVHVAGYVWRAAKVIEQATEHREAFVWDRLGRILDGGVKGVITGLRRMMRQRDLDGTARRELETVCGYFENNLARMRYDEYLRSGYPIATGVIEGACRHLVKDRMERSGMRWTLDGAQAMLHVRAVLASSFWDRFNQQRMTNEQNRLHPHAALVDNPSCDPLQC